MNPLYIKKSSGRGSGVFSYFDIEPGGLILEFEGDKFHFTEITDFTHYIQISGDYFLGPSGEADDFVNHSCVPNSYVSMEQESLQLRAISRISKDEEIVFDYATILFREPTTFKCKCGSDYCRGTVGNFYTLPIPQQDYYILNNMAPLSRHYNNIVVPDLERVAAV